MADWWWRGLALQNHDWPPGHGGPPRGGRLPAPSSNAEDVEGTALKKRPVPTNLIVPLAGARPAIALSTEVEFLNSGERSARRWRRMDGSQNLADGGSESRIGRIFDLVRNHASRCADRESDLHRTAVVLRCGSRRMFAKRRRQQARVFFLEMPTVLFFSDV